MRSRHLFVLVIVIVAASATVSAQRSTRSKTTAQPRTADIFAFVPVSDSILVVDAKRLLNETLPTVFASDTAKLSQINSELDKFKAQTGVDPRDFNRVVVAARYIHPSPTVTKLEPVAIAQGTFDVKTLMLAARMAAKGKARDEKYRGATLTVLTINDQIKMFGLWNMRVSELALSSLDSNTIAIGTPQTVRRVIDATRLRRRNSPELVALATRDPQAVIGFGGNVPKEVWAGLNMGSDAIAQDASSIKQAYGSVGTTATDVSLTLVARTETPVAAKNLGDTLTGLKQLAALATLRMSADKQALAQAALANLKINARGNELEVRTQVTASNLAALMK